MSFNQSNRFQHWFLLKANVLSATLLLLLLRKPPTLVNCPPATAGMRTSAPDFPLFLKILPSLYARACRTESYPAVVLVPTDDRKAG